jgi:hypothetical protein
VLPGLQPYDYIGLLSHAVENLGPLGTKEVERRFVFLAGVSLVQPVHLCMYIPHCNLYWWIPCTYLAKAERMWSSTAMRKQLCLVTAVAAPHGSGGACDFDPTNLMSAR